MQFKKLGLLLTISGSVINASMKAILVWIFCIHYLIQFEKDDSETQALLNSGNEVNAIMITYIKKLDLQIQQIDVGA